MMIKVGSVERSLAVMLEKLSFVSLIIQNRFGFHRFRGLSEVGCQLF